MLHRSLLLRGLVIATLPISCATRDDTRAAANGAESFGATRNARVAVEIPASESPRRQLTFLAGDLNDTELAHLRSAAPNVQIVPGLTRESALGQAAAAQGVDSRLVTPEFLAHAPSLAWVHARSAGVDRLVTLDGIAQAPKIVVTNSRAAHGPAIADHAMAMLLSLTRNLRYYDRAQSAARWEDHDPTARSTALQGRTMLVVGLGGIGTEIASRAHSFGMRVTATRRSDAESPEYIERVGRPTDLLSMLPGADVVAVCVPLTGETERMFNSSAFDAMKPGAILINIARGKVIDPGAMLAALRSGRLGGACLDVTDPEPLPASDPLWGMANVVITPHVAADAELTQERVAGLFVENMRRFGAGEPLLNVVDPKAGY